MTAVNRHVQGSCPACGSRSLFLGSGGHVTCGVIGCSNPTAASGVLSEREIEHIVVFGREGFDIQHPLRERLEGELFDCGLHKFCRSLAGPPVRTGRYRAFHEGDTWRFHPIVEAA